VTTEMLRWRDVMVGDRVVLSGVMREVASIEDGEVRLVDGGKGRPGMNGYVEVHGPEPAEALATVKAVLGGTVESIREDGKPHRCPPLDRLAANPRAMVSHLRGFHGGAETHSVMDATIHHTH
jgi:hypothetical protein